MQKELKQQIQKKPLNFFQSDYKKESTKKVWVDSGTEFAGDFKKFCVAKGIHVYSTMSETKQLLQREQSGHSKISYTDIWRNMDTNIFTNCLSLSRY